MNNEPQIFGPPKPQQQVSAHALQARALPEPALVDARPVAMPAPGANAPAIQEHRPNVPPQNANQTLHQLLRWIARVDASDLHLAADRVPAARVHGSLAPINGAGVLPAETLKEMLYGIMNERQRASFEKHHDVDLSYALDARARFRVNVFQQQGRIGSVMRLIPVKIRTAEEMKLPMTLTRLAALPRGLVLVTGPTGSGKSTLLAAIIDLANRTRRAHIVTIEDPIEFTHQSQMSVVSQRQIGEDTDSFDSALKHVLRQDPDIILVGEMRDLETTATAIAAAETGHLVFATLHTQSAPETISRIVDMFPAGQQAQIRSQLAASLQAVITQTLVKTLNGTGRMPAREVMIFNPSVRAIIREGKLEQLASSLQMGKAQGMHTLDADLARLVNEGSVSYEEALAACRDVTEFNQKTGRT